MKNRLKKLEGFVFSVPGKVKDLCSEIKEQLLLMAEKSKDLVKTNYELGLFHINKANMYDAKMRFMMVSKIRPEFAEAHYHLARCHMFDLEIDKARKELQEVLRLKPNFDEAKYRLKLISKEVDLVPTQVIKEDYDSLSSKYENYMIKEQKYNAPELLVKAIKVLLEKEKLTDIQHNILDLGCGSGFVGAELSQQEVNIKTLIGVDISSQMIEMAKSLTVNNNNIYNSIKELDFHNLSSLPKVFDIITACLSISYDSDISIILKQIEMVAATQAIFGLVVVKAIEKDVEFNYDQSCFSFRENFLADNLNQYNWQIVSKEEIKLFSDGTMGLMLICKKKN